MTMGKIQPFEDVSLTLKMVIFPACHVSFQGKFQYEHLKQLTSPCFQLQGKYLNHLTPNIRFPKTNSEEDSGGKHQKRADSLLSFQPCIVFCFSFCSNFNPVLKVELRSGGHPVVTVTFLSTTTNPPPRSRFLVTQRWRMNSRPCRKNHLSRVESLENLVTMLVFRSSGKGLHPWS